MTAAFAAWTGFPEQGILIYYRAKSTRSELFDDDTESVDLVFYLFYRAHLKSV